MKMKGSTKVLFGVIGVIGCIVLWYTVTMMQARARMEWFLRDEYGKEFVVEGVHYRYPYLGASLEITGMAHSKDDPSLKFDITRSASDNDPKTKFYGETYIQDLWEKQKREEIKSILNSDIVLTGVSATYKGEEIYGRTISIVEAERLFEGRIELYISYPIFVSLSEYKKHFTDYSNLVNGNLSVEQKKNLFLLIKKLKDFNYKKVSLIIRYYNENNRKKVEEEIKGYFKKGIYSFNVTEDALLCRIRIGDLNAITSPDDFISHINTEIADGFLNEEILKIN